MSNNQGSTEKCNKHEDPSNDLKWFLNVVNNAFFIGGSLLSIAVIFFIVHTESGRALASNAMLSDFILNTFPNAQLWVYSTIKFKQEIVLIYFYYVLLLLWAGAIMVYLFIFNWRRMVEVQKIHFTKLQVKKNLCTFKTLFKFIWGVLLLFGIIVVFGFIFFEPFLSPMAYEDYDHASGRGLDRYDVWNSYIGLVVMFVLKIHATFVLIFFLPLTVISMLICFKKNTFHTPN